MNLHDAIGAVREESLEHTGGSGATRARVLEAVSTTPRRRLHAAIAAVIASLFGASAFAYYARTPAAPAPTAPVIAVEATASEAVANPADTPAPRVVTTVRIEAPPPALVTTSLGTAAEVAPPAAPPAPPVERDAELALYSEAHRAHFVDRDLVRAVAAWDRYLAAMPDGRLAPEARFNRLVALVKLERWDDAAKAIETVDSRPADVERLRTLIESHSH